MIRTFVFIVIWLLAPLGQTIDSTSSESVVYEHDTSKESSTCHPAPTGSEGTKLATRLGFCGPIALAAGASVLKDTAPLTAAALANGFGRVGGRMILGLNIAGGITGSVVVMGLLGRGANSIEKCRVEGGELKRHAIDQVNLRGEQFEKALEDAGFTLSPQEKRQLRFPPSYQDPERLKLKLCGEMVLLAEQIKERQNRVYLKKTNGTMKVVPLPPKEPTKLTVREKTLVQEFKESLKCLPQPDYILGVCALGNYLLFRKPLPAEIKVGQSKVLNTKQKTTPKNNKNINAVKKPIKSVPPAKPIASPSVAVAAKETPVQQPRIDKPKSEPKPNADLAFSQTATTTLKPLTGRRVSPLESKLRNGVVVSRVKADKGLQGAEIVTLDNGVKAVWKPHKQQVNSNYRAEVFAYELDRKLNFNLVPPTVEYKLGGQVGSLQLFRRGKDAMEKRVEDVHQINKQSLFDYLIDHRDRHRHNFMTSQNNRLISIDNTDSMTGKSGLRGRSYDERFVEMAIFLRTNEGSQIAKALKRDRSAGLAEEVEAYFGTKDTKSFIERVDKVLELYDDFK